MDCKTARMLIDFARPRCRELDQQETDALDTHLRDCHECAHATRAEHAADERISRALKDVPVPVGMRERIIHRLQSARRPWYRRTTGRYAAAAAVLLIAVLGFAYWAGTYRPAFDVPAWADRRPAVGEESTPELVEQWFFDMYHVKAVLPRFLKYNYFVSAGRDELRKGRPVPHLFFAHGQDFAEVWVLSGDQFDLEKTIANGVQAGSGRITIKLLPDRQNPNVAYLVLYSGDASEWLFTPDPPAT
jgi:hypothetical protein